MVVYSNLIKSRIKMVNFQEEKIRKELQRVMNHCKLYGSVIKKGKRFRSAFTTEQVRYLEEEFRKYPYVNNGRRKDIAIVLNMPERAVKIWFQNRRMKEKKDILIKECESDNIVQVNEASKEIVQECRNRSLPVIQTSSNNVEMESCSRESKDKYADICEKYLKNLSTREDRIDGVKQDANPTVIHCSKKILDQNAFSSISSFEDNTTTRKNVSLDKISQNYSQTTQSSPLHHQDFTDLSHSSYRSDSFGISTTTVPQDLSLKSQNTSNTSAEQMNEVKFSSSEIPLYMKSYYPPYMPPGNFVWKPVDMSQILTSAPVSPVTLPTGLGIHNPNFVKRNCCCDCHTSFNNLITLQNQIQPVEYVLTALPITNSTR